MIIGSVLTGLNNEWDKQIEFREEERRITEERQFRTDQDDKSWSRQLENQKLGWDREDTEKRRIQDLESQQLLAAYGQLPGFSKFKPAQIASFAKAGKTGYDALNKTVNKYIEAGGDLESLINYNYTNSGGTTDSLISDIDNSSQLFSQKALTNAYKKNNEKPNTVDINISEANSILMNLQSQTVLDTVAIATQQKRLDNWLALKKKMANTADKALPSTLSKTSLESQFEGFRGAAFTQLGVQFTAQDNKVMRRADANGVSKVDQLSPLANYIATEAMEAHYTDYGNDADEKRARRDWKAKRTTALQNLKSYANNQFNNHKANSEKAGGLKELKSMLYQHYTDPVKFQEYLNGGIQKLGTNVSVEYEGKIRLFIIAPNTKGYIDLGEYDPNKYQNVFSSDEQ